MHALGLGFVGRLASIAPLILRLAVGIVFVAHGWQKMMMGPQGFGAGTLTQLGVPAPGVFAWIVTLAELVGGALLVLGLLTRIATLPPIGVMLGALVLVKSQVGLIAPQGAGAGAELDLVLLAGLLAVLILGAGPISLDRAIGIEPRVSAARSPNLVSS